MDFETYLRTLNDAQLYRVLATDLPGEKPLATKELEARGLPLPGQKAYPATDEPHILIISEDKGVAVGGRFHGWLMWRHPDGQWVSIKKLEAAALSPPAFAETKAREVSP